MNHLQAFNKFCQIYPFRNGNRIRIKEARFKFFKLKVRDLPLIIKATENYRLDRDVKAGIGIRDAHRYIRDGKGIEIWRDYIEVIDLRHPSEKTCYIPKKQPRKETPQEGELIDKMKALTKPPYNWKNRAEVRKMTIEMKKLQKQYDDLRSAPQKLGDLLKDV